MKTETLSIDLLRIDGDTQSRVAIDEDVVGDYRELIQDSGGEWPFPPLDVFCDGSAYFIADGFHRWHAANQSKRASVPCNIREGTAQDARIYGMTANDRHGLRMSRVDKRRSVEWLLDIGWKLTQTEIAEKAGVSRRTVTAIVAERKAEAAKNLPPQTGEKSANCAQNSRPGGKKQAETATDSERDNTPPEPTPFVENPDADPPPEPVASTKKASTKPAVSDPDCKALFKEYDRAIGPLVRLVDRIAGQVNGKNSESHKTVQEHLNYATEEMMEWMGVETK